MPVVITHLHCFPFLLREVIADPTTGCGSQVQARTCVTLDVNLKYRPGLVSELIFSSTGQALRHVACSAVTFMLLFLTREHDEKIVVGRQSCIPDFHLKQEELDCATLPHSFLLW
jgi:hypothetical protein